MAARLDSCERCGREMCAGCPLDDPEANVVVYTEPEFVRLMGPLPRVEAEE